MRSTMLLTYLLGRGFIAVVRLDVGTFAWCHLQVVSICRLRSSRVRACWWHWKTSRCRQEGEIVVAIDLLLYLRKHYFWHIYLIRYSVSYRICNWIMCKHWFHYRYHQVVIWSIQRKSSLVHSADLCRVRVSRVRNRVVIDGYPM